jgi:methylated-DNA-[protein]-cysteine S-methyltransferase
MTDISTMFTPVGELWLVHDSTGALTHALFGPEVDQRLVTRVLRDHATPVPESVNASPAAKSTADRLNRYFSGDLDACQSFARPGAGSEFQRAVWDALCAIPVGTTSTYAELAESIGRPKAVRAVGHANASNPLSIIVPCHRLVGADGSLRGYAGGVDAKRWLLVHEGAREPIQA